MGRERESPKFHNKADVPAQGGANLFYRDGTSSVTPVAAVLPVHAVLNPPLSSYGLEKNCLAFKALVSILSCSLKDERNKESTAARGRVSLG